MSIREQLNKYTNVPFFESMEHDSQAAFPGDLPKNAVVRHLKGFALVQGTVTYVEDGNTFVGVLYTLIRTGETVVRHYAPAQAIKYVNAQDILDSY